MFNDDVNDENIRICCKEIHFGHLILATSVYDIHVGLLVECAQILD